MKHTTTHKMLDMVLAVALAVLAGGSFISIRAQAAVSALPQRATLSTAPLTNAGGSPRDVEDEIVRVDTQLSRVIVSVEQPGPLTWEVTDDGRAQKDLLLDGPDRPLQLVILVDLAAEREKKSEECHYQRLQRELDTLARRVRLQSPPLVVVSSPRAPRLPYDLKWPSSWETVFASDLRGA